MKYKMIGILSIVLLAVLTLSAVCAADNNATDDVISMENNQDSDAVSLEQPTEQVNEDDSNQTADSDKQSNEVLAASSEDEALLTSTNTVTVLSASAAEPTKLTAAKTDTTKLKSSKKTKYITFKGKSKYKWKIKKTTWNKMKKQAIRYYKSFRKVGSYHPGYSFDVKVTLIKGGHKYKGYAMAVKNYKGIRCEVRGLPNGIRATNWGDYYPGC